MDNTTIEADDLAKFIRSEQVRYSISEKEGKKIYCCLDGFIEVVHGNAIIWRGKDIETATNVYNSITEKWTNKPR